MPAFQNPARLLVAAFALLILAGTVLLRLPIAVDGPAHPGTGDALFTATSAVTVTGLATVEIARFSLFGELVILALIQVGGFGIMTVGSILGLAASGRVGLKQRMLAQAEIGAVSLGELRALIVGIAKITLLVEAVVAVALFVPMWRDERGAGALASAYSAVFHSISGFNNAGISLYPDSFTRFGGDPFVIVVITATFIVGGLGFPVLLELRKRLPRRQWSLHARVTLLATVVLLVVGPLLVGMFEWTNPQTLGPLDTGEKLLGAWFQGTTPRTAGFNTLDTGGLNETTLLVVTALMFIGAGPASTSGGIKVTTFALLGYVLWSEVRGDDEVNMFRRRVRATVVYQAIAVVLLAIGVIVVTTLVLLASADVELSASLFEATSAFGTVGLSTGITAGLPTLGKMALVVVMLAGRVGPVTLATALALRHRARLYRYPEERPIIG